MKDLNLLLEKLKMVTVEEQADKAFQTVLQDVVQFYIDNFRLKPDEVAVLLTNEDKSVMSFAYPPFLVDSGMIPVTSPDAFASYIFKMNKGMIENNFYQIKHLHLFELVKTTDQKIKRVWKIMSTTLRADNDRFGVIEISRKSESAQESGEDFSQDNLDFLEKTIAKLAPFIKKTLPKNFRGKLV